MRYRIVQANDPELLCEQVEGLLNTGWKLHGGLLMTSTSSLYTQALINEEDLLVNTKTLTSEEVSAIQSALSNVVTLNTEQRTTCERANQILSDLVEGSSRASDTEPDKE